MAESDKSLGYSPEFEIPSAEQAFVQICTDYFQIADFHQFLQSQTDREVTIEEVQQRHAELSALLRHPAIQERFITEIYPQDLRNIQNFPNGIESTKYLLRQATQHTLYSFVMHTENFIYRGYFPEGKSRGKEVSLRKYFVAAQQTEELDIEIIRRENTDAQILVEYFNTKFNPPMFEPKSQQDPDNLPLDEWNKLIS